MSLARRALQYLGVRAKNPPNVQLALIAPTTQTAFVKGDLWLDTVADACYMWSGDTWIALGSGAVGGVVTLTGDSGGPINNVAGNIDLLGTADQIEVTGTPGTLTWSLPAAIIAPGSIESTTTITAGTGLTVTTGDIDVSDGDVNIVGNLLVAKSAAAADITAQITNSDNTSGASRAGVEIATGGSSSGDPYLSFQISGVGASIMTMGLDNSASDLFVISNSTAIGTANALTLSQAGALTATTSITATLGDITATNGNLVLNTAGNKLVYTSVATTTTAGANSAGTVTLVGGTATVSTTAVTASSKIRLTRQSVGATGANPLGELSIGTITAATSFVINAWSQADATALAATDVSSIFWEIVN